MERWVIFHRLPRQRHFFRGVFSPSRGTESSNPFSSSGESANHRFRRRFQGLDVNTERVVACFGQYLNR